MLMILGIAFFSIITATITGLIMRGEVEEVEEEVEAWSARPTVVIGELHSLVLSGAVSAAEFEAKRAELLARI